MCVCSICTLVSVQHWDDEENKMSFGLSLLTTNERIFYLSAETAELRDEWMATFREAVGETPVAYIDEATDRFVEALE